MIKHLLIKFLRYLTREEIAQPIKKPILFSTHEDSKLSSAEILEQAVRRTFRRKATDFVAGKKGAAMDSAIPTNTLFEQSITPAQLDWFSKQGFISYQMCALLAQQWLINKACAMPARDATRKGFDITINDGKKIDASILNDIKQLNKKFKIHGHLRAMVYKGRMFGIRIAIFNVESDDPEYYEKPFNILGVKPGSYKSITQVEPFWITPELDFEASSNPASPRFYEPTWWRIGSQRYHYTHLVIYRTDEVADVLKPTYFYSGISIPQKIFERVYAAERVANEAPQLALTKRTDVLKVKTEKAAFDQAEFERAMQQYVYFRDNFALKVIGEDEEMQRFDTMLSDLDDVIMSQYQLVAAASGVPSVKLLGTSPKGFNATGEFEEDSYHEELESIQDAISPLAERHLMLLIQSNFSEKFNETVSSVEIVWKPLDSLKAKEKAEIKKINAETGNLLVTSGAINGNDERKRVIEDPDSGYNGLPIENELDFDPSEGLENEEEDI